MTTTEFNVFLDNIEDLEDAFCLDQTIRTESDYGSYHHQRDKDRVFIKSDCISETLILASQEAQKYFLDLLERRWSEEGISLDAYYEMRRQLEKED